MKKGKSCEYFDGSLSDETANIRFVGFSTSVRHKLLQHQEKNDPVTLSHCQVQQSRQNDNLEVKLNSVTAIKKADKNIFINNPVDSVIKLVTIQDMAEYSTVTVDTKVLHIEDPVQLLDGRSKQDLMISDGTQYIKLTLWEAEVGKFKKYQCYRLSNLLIHEFRGEKYITTRKEGSKIEDIPDMTNVTNEEYPEPDDPSVKIIGVESVSSFKSCINCKCRVIKMEGEDEIVQCTKCNTVQFMAETISL